MVNLGYHTAKIQGKFNRYGEPLCSKKYVLNVEDQFMYPDKFAKKNIALRHYVNDVRHKFWFDIAR